MVTTRPFGTQTSMIALVLLAILGPAHAAAADDPVITTFGGNGSATCSGDGGLATAAGIYRPVGLAFDKNGNLYVGESDNRVRRITPDGIITTVAGTGVPGFSGDGGLATSAQLNGSIVWGMPVALDGQGNLYVAEFGNNRVRKVNLQGIITTIAGDGDDEMPAEGYLATTAPFGNPTAVAADDNGVYVAVIGSVIVRVTSDGMERTAVGWPGGCGRGGDGGPAHNAHVCQPYGLFLRPNGEILIADTNNNLVRRVLADGTMTTIAGTRAQGYTGDGGVATNASLDLPMGIAADAAGNTYIGDSDNHRVRRITTDGIITTMAGNGTAGYTGDGGNPVLASLNTPTGIAIDPSGNVYIADTVNNRIRKITLTTTSSGCSYALSPAIPASVPAAGGNFPVAVTASGGTCAWSSLNATNWISVQPSQGTGNAQIAITVAPNTGTSTRSATLTIAGQPVAVHQDAGPPPVTLIEAAVINWTGADCDYPALACRKDTYGIGPASVGLVFHVQYLPANSTFHCQYRRPDGSLAYEWTATPKNPWYDDAYYWYYASLNLDIPGAWSLHFDINNTSIVTMAFTVTPPATSITAVLNAATFQPGGIAPNEFITITGNGLGPPVGVGGSPSTTLGGTSVLIGGSPTLLTYAQDHQVNALVRWGVSGAGITVQVAYNGHTSAPVIAPLVASSPGIFTASYGPGQAVIANQDGTFNSAQNPAPRGTYVAFWATGQGLVAPAQQDGVQPAGPPFPTPNLPLTVTLGSRAIPPETIAFAGLVYTGVLQANIRIPDDAPTGPSVPLTVSIGTATSRADVTISIK